MQNRFYDKMSSALGLPNVASRSQWAPFGRCITPGAMARYIEGGEFYYGLEATFVPLGVAEEAPKTYTSRSIDFGESWTLLEQLSKPALDAELAAAAAKCHTEVAASLAKTVCGDYFVVASEEAVHWVSHDLSDTFKFLPSETATERVRPPLTWATPKPVDRWEGYAVKSGSDEFLHALLDGVHPLQRMTDPSDPLHGSAWLKVR